MEEHPEVGLLGGATDWVDATGRSLRVDHLPAEDSEIRTALESRCPFCQSTIFIRREAFALVGGYRAVFAQAEDYDLWLRISEHFKCANLKQVVLKYRIHPYQMSIRKRAQQTLCVLAAQVSASSRKKGITDPLNSVEEITSEALAGMGVDESQQQIAIANEYLLWIRTMYAAREYSVALRAALEVLHSSGKHLERWQFADLQLIAGRLYWKQGQFGRGLLTAGYAFLTRPVMLGRPVKHLLRWLQPNSAPEEAGLVQFSND
jgi:hypothetical protein